MRIAVAAHPSESTRIAYALGDGEPAQRARTARHLLTCEDCRGHVAIIGALRSDLRALPAPEAPAFVLDRVLAERAAGRRGMVPTTGAGRGRQMRWAWLAAAALVAAVSGVRLLDTAPPASAALEMFTATELLAAEGVVGVQDPSPIDPARVAALRPGRWRYEARILPVGSREWRPQFGESYVLDLPARGQLLWAAALSRGTTPAQADSSYYLQPSLRFDHKRVSRFGAFWCDERLADAALRRRCATGAAMDSVDFPLPPALRNGVFMGAATSLPLFLRVAPMREGATIRLPIFAQYTEADGQLVTTARTIVLHVIGTARVTVPAGTFDCWVLENERELGAGVAERLMVDRATQLLVRREATFRNRPLRIVELQRVGD